MRSLPDLPINSLPLAQAFDPWVWAYMNEIRLVGADFQFKGHEFQAEPMRAQERTVTVRKATQMAFTEGAVLKVLHAMIHRRWPKGCIYLFPTIETVSAHASSRFNPLINDNPEVIGQYLRDTNSIHLKRIGDGFLYFRSGRLSQEIQGQTKTSAGLISVPADHAVHDEYDLMSPKIDEFVDGRLSKSEIKTKTFLSNPTLPDYMISAKFDESDQRYWFVKCDHCGHSTCFDDPELTEEELFIKRIIEQLDGTVIRACSHCGQNVNVSLGQWVPRRPDVRDHAGFTIGHPSASWIDPADLLREFRTTRDIGNFIRLKLGRPYVEAQNRLSIAEVLACCGSEGIKDWESDPCFMGVDQGGGQKDLLHVVIGKKRPAGSPQYVHLGIYKGWYELDRLMKLFCVSRCVVDGLPNQDDARKFAAKHKPRVFLSYFSDTQKGSYKWDEEQLIVNSNRTEALDASHKEIQNKQIELPRKDLGVVETFARHCTAIAKKLEEDEETGSKRYVYIRLKPADHFRLANCYEAMARHDAPNWLVPEAQ